MKYLVRPSELTAYSPANHTGTRNLRLIGPETVGAGESFEMRPGEACFFPADAMHVFTVTSERAKVMVIYAPPYLEKNARLAT